MRGRKCISKVLESKEGLGARRKTRQSDWFMVCCFPYHFLCLVSSVCDVGVTSPILPLYFLLLSEAVAKTLGNAKVNSDLQTQEFQPHTQLFPCLWRLGLSWDRIAPHEDILMDLAEDLFSPPPLENIWGHPQLCLKSCFS